MSAADREKWDARWRERTGGPAAPEPFLVRKSAALARGGRILDVAAGDGRNALWLAARGFAVTAVDVSGVAIARLEEAAAGRGLQVTARAADLDDPAALAGHGSFDGLVVIRFKPSSAQWTALLAALRPYGWLLLCSFGPEQHRRHGFAREFCLERPELEHTLGRRMRLLDWQSFDEGGAFLEGSLWERLPEA